MKIIAFLFSCFCVVRIYSQITLIPTGSSDLLINISILNNNNIIVTGRDSYYSRSIDECNTLSPLAAPGPTTNYQTLNRLNISTSFMLSSNLPNYNSKIYKSNDDCNTWDLILDTNGLYVSNMKFFDANEGYAVSTFNKAVRLKNGGATRLPSTNPYKSPLILETYGDSLVAIGGLGIGTWGFFVSKDRANTWTGALNFSTLSEPRDFFFLSKDTLFAISSQGYWGPFFAKSYDGGITWQKDTIAKNNPYGLFFKNANEGYVLGQLPTGMGAIMKTTNLGQSWSIFDTQIQTTLLDMKFLNDSIALVSGTNGVLFKWNSKAAQFVTGINDVLMNNFTFSVFPNPITNKAVIQSNYFSESLRVSITNSFGQIIIPETFIEPKQEIDLSYLSKGVYYLSAQSSQGRKVVKLVKE